MILTLKELAEYLRVNERTIMRMRNAGKIEGTKIGGQWRFNSCQIDAVFFPGKGNSDDESKDNEIDLAHDEPQSVLCRPAIGIPVSRVMDKDRILLDLKSRNCTDKEKSPEERLEANIESVIGELTDARMLVGLVPGVSDLRANCIKREKSVSTGVGGGFAIPHPRDPITTLRASAAIIYGYSKEGIDMNAADGQPVHHFFLILSQNIELHVHLMGCMGRLLRDEKFTAALPKCKANADVIKLVMEHERNEFLHNDEE